MTIQAAELARLAGGGTAAASAPTTDAPINLLVFPMPAQVNSGVVVAVGPGRRTSAGELIAPSVKEVRRGCWQRGCTPPFWKPRRRRYSRCCSRVAAGSLRLVFVGHRSNAAPISLPAAAGTEAGAAHCAAAGLSIRARVATVLLLLAARAQGDNVLLPEYGGTAVKLEDKE